MSLMIQREHLKKITKKSLFQQSGVYKNVSIKWFFDNNLSNAGLERIKLALKGENQFPDKPRINDNGVVKYFMETKIRYLQ
jgi:hypothetical protein